MMSVPEGLKQHLTAELPGQSLDALMPLQCWKFMHLPPGIWEQLVMEEPLPEGGGGGAMAGF